LCAVSGLVPTFCMDFKNNHFELFELPETFGIDTAKLESAYKDIQHQVHPDRFASRGEAEKRLSMQWATLANEAYRTLKSPLPRALYLLKLRGIDAMDHTNTAMPPAFLMQQMEWREMLADARAAKSMETLDRLMKDMRGEVKQLEAELALLLDETKDYEAAAVSARKLRFLHKLIEEIGDAQEELELA
jgi:molecular chaperone HscB